MIIGNKKFSKNKAYIVGILNATSDSFYDGNLYNNIDKAMIHCEQMIKEGADIIDVGGESTRPGYKQINFNKEINNVYEIIRNIKLNFDIVVSIDTYKHQVAQACIDAGVDMINDIWGLKYDNGEMAKIISKYNLSCCLMHNRLDNNYSNLITDIVYDIKKSLEIATRYGINKEKIIIDPGLGFAKTYSDNINIIKNLEKIKNALNMPMLIGASNKSFIGKTLNEQTNNRLEGTIAVNIIALLRGATFFRVHNVKENKRAIKMVQKIIEKE